MNRTLETMKRCLSEGPEAVLTELGFERDGALSFRRRSGDVHDVVEVQLSDSGTEGAGMFVFELGAQHDRVRELMGYRRLKKPAAGACTVRTRLNRNDDDNDAWWLLTPGRESVAGRHAAHRLRQTIEKWFTIANDLAALSERVNSRDEDFWCPDSLAPAAIAMALGQPELGRARIDALLKRIHDWREFRLERFKKNDPHGTAVLETAHFMTTGKRTKRFRINWHEWEQLRY